ncbi:MAG: rod shape-determining protein MreC [Fibrobacterota bacterium]
MLRIIAAYHRGLTLAALLIISLWLSNRALERKAYIAKSFQQTVFLPFQVVLNFVNKIDNIIKENRVLRKQNTSLSMQNAFLKEKAIENKRLREALNFKEESTYSLIAAKVAGKTPGGGLYSITITPGSLRGIKPNMPAVTPSGLVGKVVETAPFSSTVQLLNDPDCRPSVMLSTSRAVGILSQSETLDPVVEVRRHTEAQNNEQVITSGMGGVFPKGLPVGIVSEIRDGPNRDIFKEVVVKLNVNPEFVEEMFILVKEDSWIPENK